MISKTGSLHFYVKCGRFPISFFKSIPEGDTTTVHCPLATVHCGEAAYLPGYSFSPRAPASRIRRFRASRCSREAPR